MKKLRKTDRVLYIDIVADIIEVDEYREVAASDNILPQHRDSILPKYKISDAILRRYQDLVMSVISTIGSFSPDIQISNTYQSKQSYTCYIPILADRIDWLEVRFRLADHEFQNTQEELEELSNSSGKRRTYIKSLAINGEAMKNEIVLLDAVYNICEGLIVGDIDPLLQNYNL